jgi:Uma2 family endonuclease
MATTILLDLLEDQFEIPMDLRSLADFRAWAVSDSFPERGRIDYLDGRIEVDMSPEDLYCHGKVKTELVAVLWQRIKQRGLGDLYTDRARVSCPGAQLSVEPDLVFISEQSLATGRVRMVSKAGQEPGRYIELEGPPELVVEIISDSSVKKDSQRLPAAYYQAGLEEYWLVDARKEPLLFRIHGRGPSSFEPVAADAEGYQRSAVLGCRYRLDRRQTPQGRVAFDLLACEGSVSHG